MIEIHENYKSFVPPAWFRPTVERLLDSLRTEQFGGLQSVVLTDSASIGRGKSRRVGREKKKYHLNRCYGLYYPEWYGEPAWIRLIVDNMIAGYPAWFLRVPVRFFRDMAVAEVLYHELGHHLHERVGSAARGGEESADSWKGRLSKSHFRRRYWYLRPLVVVALRLRERFSEKNKRSRRIAAARGF